MRKPPGSPTHAPARRGACYGLATRPSLVEHVGASSALFGSAAANGRFHMSDGFLGGPIALPGRDSSDAW